MKCFINRKSSTGHLQIFEVRLRTRGLRLVLPDTGHRDKSTHAGLRMLPANKMLYMYICGVFFFVCCRNPYILRTLLGLNGPL